MTTPPAKQKCPGCCNNQGTPQKQKTITETAQNRIINRIQEELIQMEITRYLHEPNTAQELAAVLELPLDTLQPVIDRLKRARNLHQQVNYS